MKRGERDRPFAHVDLVIADENVAVDDAATLGADGARELVEDAVGVLLRIGNRSERLYRMCHE